MSNPRLKFMRNEVIEDVLPGRMDAYRFPAPAPAARIRARLEERCDGFPPARLGAAGRKASLATALANF